MTYQGIQQFNSGYISLYFTKVKILNKSIKERPKLDAVNLAIFRRIFKNHLKIYGNKHSKKYLIHFIKLKSKRGVIFWCACSKSKSQPFCDGSHKFTDFTPVKHEAKESKKVFFVAVTINRHSQCLMAAINKYNSLRRLNN